jgi:hypothetical protein
VAQGVGPEFKLQYWKKKKKKKGHYNIPHVILEGIFQPMES